jgi:hypothetical protein
MLFGKSIPVPHEHEKECIDISLHGHTEMHYVTHRSHRMQKHNLFIMCPGALFLESVLVRPEDEK